MPGLTDRDFRGGTMTEKILARAAGAPSVRPGDAVVAAVSGVSLVDGVNYGMFDRYPNLRLWDPARVVFCVDHLLRDSMSADLRRIQRFAEAQRVPPENVFGLGRHGLSHQIPAEHGFVLPGSVYVTFDSQGSSLGAFNCFAFGGVWSTPAIMATGDAVIVVPEVVRLVLVGRLSPAVTSKDVGLHILAKHGTTMQGRAVEVAGPAIRDLSIDNRMGIANIANSVGAFTFVFPAEERLFKFLAPIARWPFEAVAPSDDATYAATIQLDLGAIEPVVSGPHDLDRVQSLSAVVGTEITAAYVGSCSAGRFDDLARAAAVLAGRHIDPRVRLVITPISSQVMLKATREGVIEALVAAGATVTSPGCGACYHGNQSPLLLDDGERCITTSTSNLPGRMGSVRAEIYLANPAVVAASALEGRIADPGPYLQSA